MQNPIIIGCIVFLILLAGAFAVQVVGYPSSPISEPSSVSLIMRRTTRSKTPSRLRHSLATRYCAYWNGGLAFRLSFVAPGRTNFFVDQLELRNGNGDIVCPQAEEAAGTNDGVGDPPCRAR